jgi:hypothetical protein
MFDTILTVLHIAIIFTQIIIYSLIRQTLIAMNQRQETILFGMSHVWGVLTEVQKTTNGLGEEE